MENFTPVSSILGGVLIGIAAAMMMLFHGRIAGISGILGGLLSRRMPELEWRFAFVTGLLVAGLALRFVMPEGFAVDVERSPAAIVVAGVLVGFGTRLGSGCTSGHGICGISRVSPRSILATLTFMGAGGITAAAVTHLLGGVL